MLFATIAAGMLLTALVPRSAVGVSVTIPSGTALPNPSITSSVPSLVVQDLSVTITDNLTTVDPGSNVKSIVTIRNRSPENANVQMIYNPPPSHQDVTFKFLNSKGETGPYLMSKLLTNPVGVEPFGISVLTFNATVSPTATGIITSAAVIVPDLSFGDVNSSNNTAVDTTLINPPTTKAATTTTGSALQVATIPVATTTVTTNAPTTTVATTTVSATSGATIAPVAATPPPPAATATVDGFQSPSGATMCRLMANSVTGQAIRCTVTGSTARLPRRPATCDFDWEDIAVNSTGRAYPVCAGDSIDGNYPVLAYGQTWKRSVFTCTSAKSGITCRNQSKRGFRITKIKRAYL